MDNFTESQYKEIWDMIFSQTGYPPNHPKHETKAPKEEQVPIKVQMISFYTSMSEKLIRDVFSVRLTGDISEDKLQSIKEAIEGVLNETLVELNNEQLGKILMSFHKNHSEELLQARRDAFDAAREVNYVNDAFFNDHYESLKRAFIKCSKHKSSEYYINSLNK